MTIEGSPGDPLLAGVLLAGGQSRRMGGGDKCLRLLGGETILSRAIARARPQVAALALNANGDPGRFAEYRLPVVSDPIEGFPGPLAGVLAGLDWAADAVPRARYLISFACDAPFFPIDLAVRLLAPVARGEAELSCAASDERSHPVFGLWPLALREPLRQALVEEGLRKVDLFTGRYRLAMVAFALRATTSGPLDPFFNANRPEDLARAEALLAAA